MLSARNRMNPTESKPKTGRSITVSDGSEIINTNSPKQQGVSLSVSGLRKSYNGIEVLKGIDFDVNPGEIFVIMGPSGSGKSVLLRQLIGLEEPDQGKVLIEGQPIQSPDIPSQYRVAMVFQSGALLTSMTVGENVGFYLTEHHLKSPGEIAEIVSKDLEQVGLKGTENKMPDELSGGMRKRVAIARALAVEPQLILYDEPTSELDPVSAVSIAEDIVKLNQRIHATTWWYRMIAIWRLGLPTASRCSMKVASSPSERPKRLSTTPIRACSTFCQQALPKPNSWVIIMTPSFKRQPKKQAFQSYSRFCLESLYDCPIIYETQRHRPD